MIGWLDRRWALPALAVALLVATALAWAGLGALRHARADLAETTARAQAGARPPQPLLAEGLSHREAARADAATALLARLGAAALQRHLLVERIMVEPESGEHPAELAAALILSGPETDILAFARAVEGGRPLVRFSQWRLARTGRAETAIRLEARAVGYWEPR